MASIEAITDLATPIKSLTQNTIQLELLLVVEKIIQRSLDGDRQYNIINLTMAKSRISNHPRRKDNFNDGYTSIRSIWSTFARSSFVRWIPIILLLVVMIQNGPKEYSYEGLEQFNREIALSKKENPPMPSSTLPLESSLELSLSAESIDNNNENETYRRKVHDILHHRTPSIGDHEIILTSFLPSLLREEGMVPEGIIFDVGTQHGEQAAHYAITAPSRQILAMDPSDKLVEEIRNNFGKLPNLRVEQGGVGKTVGVMKPRDSSFNMDLDQEFKIYTLDSLFYDKGERLGLLHLDVEGLELDVLKGGLQTLRAYKPIMTTEVRVHKDPEYTKELLELLDREGYDSYVINEVCGYPHMDYRNILNIPRGLSARFADSDTANILLATEAIARVAGNEDWSIFKAVYPCCALGGECCPGNDINAKSCCSESLVVNYLTKNNLQQKPPSMMGWRSGRISFHKWQRRLRQRQKVK